MIKGQDVVVLLGLLGPDRPQVTLPELSESLGLSLATIHRSLTRLQETSLVVGRDPQLAQVDEFLAHALRYLFPAALKGEARGIATAWGAPPLNKLLTQGGGPPPVWPHPAGRNRGIALEPLHPAVPDLALKDRDLYGKLALVDGLRMGDARVRKVARDELRRLYRDH